MLRKFLAEAICAAGLLTATVSAADAAPVFWTDWLGVDTDTGPGFTGLGTITTTTSTVGVTYTNAAGIGFYQSSGGIDYWVPRVPVSDSPYVSALVDNPPPDSDIVALQFAGNQTLSFSQAIANPVFSYVSLNGNGYAFLNQDFDILSFDCGYWGCGTSTKNVVDLGGGNFEYQLLGSGEPHGTIRFTGAFDTVTWRSLSNEFWNGFTVGIQGTADEVFPPTEAPEPFTLSLFGLGVAGVVAIRRRRKMT